MATAGEVLARLRDDGPYYAENLARIIDKRSELVPLMYRPSQWKLWNALEGQRKAGRPMRVIVGKSRQTGISTMVQALLIQRCTLKRNRRALVVAQDNDTAGSLFEIGETIYLNLPADEPALRPATSSHQRSSGGRKTLEWRALGREARNRGDLGINSMLRVDTAKEVEAGRGKTITDLHASEVAYWPDPRKALSLMNAVPDAEDTLVVLESTANGHNFFKQRWDRAMRGEGDFAPVFVSWLEDPDCVKPVPADKRAEFERMIGDGPWGAEEPLLVEMGATLEQLYWRRTAIVDKCDGKLELFKQEYPSTAEEMFVGSGRHVFSIVFIQRAVHEAKAWEARSPEDGGPQRGVFKPVEFKHRQLQGGTVEVPTKVLWVPAEETGLPDHHPWWTRWETPDHPTEWWREAFDRGEIDEGQMELGVERALTRERFPAQFVVAVDPAGDIDSTDIDRDTDMDRSYQAIQVIDHRTGEQVAEWQARTEHDHVAEQALLAGLYFNTAWLSVEVTGGYGMAMVAILFKRYGYRRLYERQRLDNRKQQTIDRLGWSTDRATTPMMEAGIAEMLREGTHGIRSLRLALQLTTYVKDDRGRHGPDDEAFDDHLKAFMQGHEIRRLKPLRKKPTEGPRPTSLTRRLPWG